MAPRSFCSPITLVFLLPLVVIAPVGDSARAQSVVDPKVATTLSNRLKLVDEEAPPSYCWDSLVQLQSCTGEAIMFFLNGEAYLGDACCTAIRTVGEQCWPDMLRVLGFTEEEGDMLEGYCDDQHDAGRNQSLAAAANEPAAAVPGSVQVDGRKIRDGSFAHGN